MIYSVVLLFFAFVSLRDESVRNNFAKDGATNFDTN